MNHFSQACEGNTNKYSVQFMAIYKQGEISDLMFNDICEVSPKIAIDRISSFNMLLCRNSAFFSRHTMRLNNRRLQQEQQQSLFVLWLARYLPAAVHTRNRYKSIRHSMRFCLVISHQLTKCTRAISFYRNMAQFCRHSTVNEIYCMHRAESFLRR
jgi:hypothetical protein